MRTATSSDLGAGVADLLADVLARRPIRGAVSARLELAAPWALRFPHASRAGFHVVLGGSCRIEGEGERALTLREGDVVLLPHGSAHVLSSDPPGSPMTMPELARGKRVKEVDGVLRSAGRGALTALMCGVHHFDESEPHPVLAQLPRVVHVRADAFAGDPALRMAIELLRLELARGRAGGRTVSERLVDVLFVSVVRAWVDAHGEDLQGWLPALRDPQIARTLAVMHAGIGSELRLERLAREARMSLATFKRRFGELVGRSPGEYLIELRMDEAARLLRGGGLGIAEVASRVGYTSEYAFSRAFRRHTGIAPGRFRDRSRSE